jgi:hypothetical protein
MKSIKYMPYVALILFLGLPSCEFRTSVDNISKYDPVYINKSELKNSVFWASGEVDLKEVGKIYTKDNLLFINELYKGVHIFDNRNPASPQKIGFLHIAGNVDIAIKHNFLYADNAIDLVVVDLSDLPNKVRVVARSEGVFPEMNIAPDGQMVSNPFKDKVIMAWKKRTN